MTASPPPADALREALPVAAVHSAIRWVEENIAPRRCDSDGVADCWRCTTVAIARWLDAAVAAVGQPAQDEAVRERLAAIEHDQWIEWSRTIATEGLTPERIERWRQYWVPYADLDESTKDHDRKWADTVLAALTAAPAPGLDPRVGSHRHGAPATGVDVEWLRTNRPTDIANPHPCVDLYDAAAPAPGLDVDWAVMEQAFHDAQIYDWRGASLGTDAHEWIEAIRERYLARLAGQEGGE